MSEVAALGIVALTIGVPHHRRAPCLAGDPAAPSQECEATGKKHATFWRLTSPGTPAILRGVGRSPGHTIPRWRLCGSRGGSTLIGGSGVWRKTPDELWNFILLTSSLLAEHISGERAKLSPPDQQNNRSNSQSVGKGPVLCAEQSSCGEKSSKKGDKYDEERDEHLLRCAETDRCRPPACRIR
jgi:hypothetical protein